MIGRRHIITLLGGAAGWPIAVRAQQPIAAVGFLSSIASGDRPHHTEAFRQGLDEAGFVEGRNVRIEYRFAEHRMDQLRPLAAELIARKVDVIAALGGTNTALIVKALTSTIPILFTTGADPVMSGLVASLSRPEANVTGVSWFSTELGSKHIEVLHEFVPQTAPVAMLVNPNNPEAGFYQQSAQDGARAFGRQLLVLNAGTVRDIDAAFATLSEQRAGALIVAADPFYPGRARQLAVLAARHALPMLSAVREITTAGGLISYGNSVTDAYRRVGILAGRILKGAKPADLPVDRAVRFELVINLGSARALGLEVPPTLLARADEVIE